MVLLTWHYFIDDLLSDLIKASLNLPPNGTEDLVVGGEGIGSAIILSFACT